MFIAYLIGFLAYLLSVTISYSEKFKSSSWYFPTGIAIAILANFIWLYIAKHSLNKNDIYIRALIWDSMIVGCYALIPFIFYGVRFSTSASTGIALIIIGMLLTKL